MCLFSLFHFVKIVVVVVVVVGIVVVVSFIGDCVSCFLSTETPGRNRLKLQEEAAYLRGDSGLGIRKTRLYDLL